RCGAGPIPPVVPAMRILIPGRAGNLGGLLARPLAGRGDELRLMYPRRPLAPDVATAPGVVPVRADLSRPETLKTAVENVDVAVHFAGGLFRPRPERFLPETNVRWVGNLVGGGGGGRAGPGPPVFFSP